MFGFTEPTAYDLNFRLFRTPVRVHPLFWLVSAILGMGPTGRGDGFGLILMWVGAVFVSILVHEFGHVFAAHLCGWKVNEVVLHQWGGHASMVPPYGPRWAINDILISLAGPVAGFCIALFIFLSREYFPRFIEGFGAEGDVFWSFMFFINLVWGLFNLLPIFPLDGGQATRTFLTALFRSGGDVAALISVVTAGLVAMWMFRTGNFYMGILMISLGLTNLQMLGQRRY